MNSTEKKGFMQKFLGGIESVGNRLPHSTLIFIYFAIGIAIVSYFCALFDLSVVFERINTSTKELQKVTIKAVSLLTPDGIRFMFTQAVSNYTTFAPLGTVLVMVLGSSIAEHSGLIGAVLRKTMYGVSSRWVPFAVVFMGVMGSLADDAAYVMFIPLGAIVFLGAGRHPVAGLFAAFAGVSGGYSANLFVTSFDPLLGGISTEAARLIDPSYVVQPVANWYFMVVYTFVLALVGAFVTVKVIEPRLGQYNGDQRVVMEPLNDVEKRGVRYARNAFLLFVVFIAFLVLPPNAVLRNPTTGSIIDDSPFLFGLVTILMLGFTIPGVAYGIGAGTVKTHRDVVGFMGRGMSSMSLYLVIVFAASQFVAYFRYSNLGTILAVKGAEFLERTGLVGFPLITAFILVAATINLVMSSGSAKWAILAPVFVPMLMRVGYSPEFVQVAYRIGDSSTNIITPIMSYYAMIIVFAQKYDKEIGVGSIVSMMLPYSLAFLFSGIALLSVFYFAGLPVGVGANIFLN